MPVSVSLAVESLHVHTSIVIYGHCAGSGLSRLIGVIPQDVYIVLCTEYLTASLPIDKMKRNRIQFEANGEHTSTSPPQGAVASEGHIPKISRRIRACTECKKHKVRCNMNPGESICQRCRRMNLECVVHKSLQTLLEDETECASIPCLT